MITFKQFVQESDSRNVKVDWKVARPRMSDGDILRFLKRNCSKAFGNYKENKKALYRGFNNGILASHSPIAIVDTTQSLRRSLHSNNTYQVLFKMSPHMTAIPDRMTSMICSTRKETADVYATKESSMMVFPFDDCVLAYNEGSDDVLYTGKMRIFGKDVEYSLLNKLAHVLGENVGMADNMLSEVTPEVLGRIDSSLKGASDEWVFLLACSVLFDSAFKPTPVFKAGSLSSHLSNILGKLSDNTFAFTMAKPDKFNWFEDNVGNLNLSSNLTPFGQTFYAWVKASKPKGFFQSFAEDLMLSEESHMKVISPGDPLPNRTEIWFTGHALIISPRSMADVMAIDKDPSKEETQNVDNV